ncbi:class I SAM-dependent methyltransferase [Sphingobium sp. 3R8]|uniref:O-methyltransferase n=1 Tax=Sphingobium sp. 3R8 TaxID=2874921 RepID=UPI001CCEA9AD|nr:class I SAM-dependent methyltransferase [Sphingobium sp. 3R8]MBZ9648544.1 class I SAM-dependent methyltransferase [Sphingobium sp. 3R8]
MTMLLDPRVTQMLDRLHREAETADSALMAEIMGQLEIASEPLEVIAARMVEAEKADLALVYQNDHAEHFLSVTPEYGRYLYALARARRATRIVEFGTSMGVSTVYLAAALRDNGGGKLIGSELAPGKVARARAHIEAAGFADLVEIREGDALETLKDVGGAVDLVLVDGAWSLYLPVLKLIEPALAPGAIVLGENAFDPDYIAYVRDPANGYLSQPLAINESRGNEFTVRVG